MKVLVTGATGFVGSHAAKALQDAGHRVRALVRTPSKLETVTARVGVDPASLETVQGDIRDAGAVTAAVDGCEAVVHAAAVVSIDPASETEVSETNFPGALNVLDAAVGAGCDPVVHVSTGEALFPFRTDPVTVDHPVGTAPGAYARSKAQSEHLARRYQSQGHGVVIVYPALTIGPGDYNQSVQLQPMKLWLTKPLPRSGYTMTMVDVRDVAAVIAASMEAGRGPRRYLMFGHHLTAGELLSELQSVTGRDLKSVPVPRALFSIWGRVGDVANRFGRDLVLTTEAVDYMFNYCAGDNSATEQDTGIVLRPVAESLADTIAWMRDEGHVSAAQAGAVP
ncbi:MAG: SDR family NAD(P)-dependent oxidoreductase [Acidimicrobiaceae bacterium]|nr:SDR family NAD(P)-dependent oxidoreductase [Acidimicrobiaceae bacterium]MYH76236.1 SDR family NAD(P)-dependent oxidoreductase [Acidimicrobiaceae bacterium]MYK76409.1 SDR family NAD(P)-dependent oxidoreductase [Acidimicrobiaceae bacterium]